MQATEFKVSSKEEVIFLTQCHQQLSDQASNCITDSPTGTAADCHHIYSQSSLWTIYLEDKTAGQK